MNRLFSGFVKTGWLIDGSGGPVLENRTIAVSKGTITSIQPTPSADSASAEILDLSEHTVLPALIDSHVHLFMSGTTNQQERIRQLDAGYDDIRPAIEKHIQQHLSCGILAVRDGGDRQAHALRYKETSFRQDRPGFDLKVAGKAWRKSGRYGRLIGRSPSGRQTLAEAIFADRSAVDHVKIVNSGLNSLVAFGHQTAHQFELDELAGGIAAAARRNLPVMVHANGTVPVAIAIDAGCDSIEHGFFMNPKNMDKMAEKQIAWIPTVFTMKAFADHLARTGRPNEVAVRNLEHQLEQIRRAKAAGVRIVVGTDAGSIGVHHGSGIIEEMRLFMQAGLTLAETVCCATHRGAELIGLKDTGLLAEGMAASFIACRGKPAELPASLTAIEQMILKGFRFTPK